MPQHVLIQRPTKSHEMDCFLPCIPRPDSDDIEVKSLHIEGDSGTARENKAIHKLLKLQLHSLPSHCMVIYTAMSL